MRTTRQTVTLTAPATGGPVQGRAVQGLAVPVATLAVLLLRGLAVVLLLSPLVLAAAWLLG